ncbi:hypothetical protein pb186bvf_007224 [Paramecium bursaria]
MISKLFLNEQHRVLNKNSFSQAQIQHKTIKLQYQQIQKKQESQVKLLLIYGNNFIQERTFSSPIIIFIYCFKILMCLNCILGNMREHYLPLDIWGILTHYRKLKASFHHGLYKKKISFEGIKSLLCNSLADAKDILYRLAWIHYVKDFKLRQVQNLKNYYCEQIKRMCFMTFLATPKNNIMIYFQVLQTDSAFYTQQLELHIFILINVIQINTFIH